MCDCMTRHTCAVTTPPTDWAGEHVPLTGAPEPDLDAEPESLVVQMDTGERMHYLDWGAPSPPHELPPLLLVHGLSQTAWAWAPIARRLRTAARVLSLDLRGHGLSESPRAGYELESLAIDALTIAVANRWGRDVGGPPVAVAGHGFGAQVAATMAVLQPESVCGVALVDGGWEGVGEATRMSPTEFGAAVAEPPEVLASMDAFLADRRGYDPGTWDADQERAARAQVDQKHAGHVAPVARPGVVKALVEAMFSYRPWEVLPAVSCPLLAVVAESGSADDDEARERRLALDEVMRAREGAGRRAARIAVFRGSGHNLMRYRADELTAELLALLEAGRGVE